MEKFGKVFSTLILFSLLMFGNTVMARSFYDNSDPRVQKRDQKVMLMFLNQDQVKYSVKVYSPKNRLIRWQELGDAVVIGKILDFSDSEKGMYRIKVSAQDEVLFDQRLRLGDI